MIEWINVIVAAICSLIGAFGGGGLLYWKYNKQLKAIEVTHNQADEWKRLYEEADEERKAKDQKIDRLYQERNEAREEVSGLKLRVQQLTWYHCTVNGCKRRQPPHVFDMDGNEIAINPETKQEITV